ncbi:hypothetical protein BCR39DRAFT_246027 [Naematelia encephala]|uniref:Stress-response A/B barrel domain-containing protein n=1 Tax=Naematelia encephala TaxID=71784 RepID=A0A1Y2AWL1_9TREE|nr:hypothetical protein BCR39DRAFT_246027 [Naematelia encephala]
MVGQVPGLISVESGHGLVSTLHRGKGYNYGVVAILEKGDDVAVYAAHPSHLKTTEARLLISDGECRSRILLIRVTDFLAFDLLGGN